MKALQKLMNDIHQWADKTFGEKRTAISPAFHLKKEVNELIEAYESDNKSDWDFKEELADCFILVLNIASKYGLDADDLMNIAAWKMAKNKTRKWGKPDENGVVEHIRE